MCTPPACLLRTAVRIASGVHSSPVIGKGTPEACVPYFFPTAEKNSAMLLQESRFFTVPVRHSRCSITLIPVGEFVQRRASFRKVTAVMKKIAAVLVGIPLMATALLISVPARSASDDDAAALYNTKCKMCHGATAEKKMDKTKADDGLIQIVMDGKAAEKPPNMPAFKEKGISADQAKALVEYMKSLK